MAQKTVYEAHNAAVATEIAVKVIDKLLPFSATILIMPAAISKVEAACQRRSPRRSERRLHQVITMAAAIYGIAAYSPTWKVLVTPAAFSMVGSQKLTV